MIDYFVHLIKLPTSCYGLSTVNRDGTYTILINKDIPYEVQQVTFKHELKHIILGHFHNDEKSISTKEWEAIG